MKSLEFFIMVVITAVSLGSLCHADEEKPARVVKDSNRLKDAKPGPWALERSENPILKRALLYDLQYNELGVGDQKKAEELYLHTSIFAWGTLLRVFAAKGMRRKAPFVTEQRQECISRKQWTVIRMGQSMTI